MDCFDPRKEQSYYSNIIINKLYSMQESPHLKSRYSFNLLLSIRRRGLFAWINKINNLIHQRLHVEQPKSNYHPSENKATCNYNYNINVSKFSLSNNKELFNLWLVGLALQMEMVLFLLFCFALKIINGLLHLK